jgi:hypothetical protein
MSLEGRGDFPQSTVQHRNYIDVKYKLYLSYDYMCWLVLSSQVHDIPVAYKFGKKMAVSEWGWLDPAGGMFSTINDFAKVNLIKNSLCVTQNLFQD